MSRRSLYDRLSDRAWSCISSLLEDPTPPPEITSDATCDESVSGTLAWPKACRALARGDWNSRGFRRTRATRQVVETLGLTDGRYFARYIMRHHPEWLIDLNVRKLNDWGDPIQAPSWALGTPRPFSPTSLRYLAHALWMKHEGFVVSGGLIAEIGVGFGGLAAMNSLVSHARTVLIDLPDVERTASLMMEQNDLSSHLVSRDELTEEFSLVSNYAFTELSKPLQNSYFGETLIHAKRGVIVSNAAIFAKKIGGRSNEDLVAWFRDAGLDARVWSNCPILCPSDIQLDNKVITWTTR